jgi:hypothetical protein
MKIVIRDMQSKPRGVSHDNSFSTTTLRRKFAAKIASCKKALLINMEIFKSPRLLKWKKKTWHIWNVCPLFHSLVLRMSLSAIHFNPAMIKVLRSLEHWQVHIPWFGISLSKNAFFSMQNLEQPSQIPEYENVSRWLRVTLVSTEETWEKNNKTT